MYLASDGIPSPLVFDFAGCSCKTQLVVAAAMTGSDDSHLAALQFLRYFEGMLFLRVHVLTFLYKYFFNVQTFFGTFYATFTRLRIHKIFFQIFFSIDD